MTTMYSLGAIIGAQGSSPHGDVWGQGHRQRGHYDYVRTVFFKVTRINNDATNRPTKRHDPQTQEAGADELP